MSAAGGEKRKTLEKWTFRGVPQVFRRALSRRVAIFAAFSARFHQFRKNTPLTFRGINAIVALLFVWGAMPLNESEVEKCPTQYLKKRLNGLTKRSRTLSFCSFVFFCLKKLPPPSPFLPTKGLASMISRT
jgi:hypothetical protein